MRESIKAEVVSKDDTGVVLEIEFDDDAISLLVDGKEICGGGWSSNFSILFQRAFDLWPIIAENRE